MTDKLLYRLNDVSFSYGRTPVLKDINIELRKAKFYGLIGGNGSGKSTLLELMTGTLPPNKGRITYRNKRLSTYSKLQLATKIALVPQHFSMDFEYSVKDIVLMGRHPHIPRFSSPSTYDHESTRHAMESMDILHLEDRPIVALSGGELQRVVIARALAQETEVLILDEATSNLDIHHTISIMRVIRRRVKEDGLTVIAAIHDLNLAAAFCDECVVLKDSCIFASGTVNTIFTKDLLQTVFTVDASVQSNPETDFPHIQFRY